MSSPRTGRCPTLDLRHHSSARTPGNAVPTRAYQPRHNASTTAATLPPPKTEGPPNAGLQAVQLDKRHSISALASCRLAAGRLCGRGAHGCGGYGFGDGCIGWDLDAVAVVADQERRPLEQRVGRLVPVEV